LTRGGNSRRTVGVMDEHDRTDEDRTLSVQLIVHLHRRPISGELRDERGSAERFEGWLGFIDALKRADDSAAARPAERSIGRGPTKEGTS